MAIDLTPYAEAVNSALLSGTPCVVATSGSDGMPAIALKGSVMVFDGDHLAYWERSKQQQLANLTQDPGVAILYFSPTQRKYVRFYGKAELYREGPLREQIMTRVIPQELERDPERGGVAVLIRIDKIEDPFGAGLQVRD